MKDAVKDLRYILNSDEFFYYQLQREKSLIAEHAALKQAEEMGAKKASIEMSISAIKEGYMTFLNAIKISKLTCDELKEASDKEGIQISPEELKTAKDA